MATIDFSPALVKKCIMDTSTKAVSQTSVPNSLNNPLIGLLQTGVLGSSNVIGKLTIFKGVMPTTVADIYPTMTRQTDGLLTFHNGVGGNQLVCSYIANPNAVSDYDKSMLNFLSIKSASAYTTSAVTGIATWFAITQDSGNYMSVTANGQIVNHTIIGSVGTIGSGADLEIPFTSIVAGTKYKLGELLIEFPTKIEY